MKRILCIDGGGIKGVYPATILAEFEKQLEAAGKNPRLYKYFDLMSGTSTGGIIAVGLALGIPAAQIASMYETKGPRIFNQDRPALGKKLRKFRLNAKHAVGTKYKPDELHKALKGVLEDRQLGDAKTRLLIPSVHAPDNSPRVFKTRHSERFINDHKRLALDICMSTAAAPTYFEAHETFTGELMADGGLMANNPIAMATIEGVGELGWPKEELQVLSISCLSSPSHVPDKVGGLEFLVKHSLEVFNAVASENAVGMARILLEDHGGNTHKAVHRIDTQVAPGRFSLDATEGIRELKSLGKNKAVHEFTKIKNVFFNDEAEPFTPIKEIR